MTKKQLYLYGIIVIIFIILPNPLTVLGASYSGSYEFTEYEEILFPFNELSPGNVISISLNIVEGNYTLFKIGPLTSIEQNITSGITTYTGDFELNLDYTIGGFNINENDICILIAADNGVIINYDFHLKSSVNYWLIVSSITIPLFVIISTVLVIIIVKTSKK